MFRPEINPEIENNKSIVILAQGFSRNRSKTKELRLGPFSIHPYKA